MSRLSKRKIIAAAQKKFGLQDFELDLIKSEGEYYWSGRVSYAFYRTCIGFVDMNTPLDYWLDDFEMKIKEFQSKSLNRETIREYLTRNAEFWDREEKELPL